MQDKHVVVAHFNEDRNILINKLKYPHTVIHKGNQPKPGDIIQKNIGKDCYAYLKYIVDNYDNLHEYEIFTQANPDDHVHEFLLAIESTFTAGYGNFGYARSIYKQYGLDDDISIPINQFLKACGIKFINDNNCSKTLYIANPGCIFYVHRDRIRQRPKIFYEKLMSFIDTDSVFDLVWNEEYPDYIYEYLRKNFSHLNNLNKFERIKSSFNHEKHGWMRLNDKIGDYFSALMEAVWVTIFMSIESLEKLNIAQAAYGNKLYLNTNFDNYDLNNKFYIFPFSQNIHQTMMNFRIMIDNDAFDWNCPYYLKWREKLIEKTIWEGEQKGFDGRQLLEYYERLGYKHISL